MLNVATEFTSIGELLCTTRLSISWRHGCETTVLIVATESTSVRCIAVYDEVLNVMTSWWWENEILKFVIWISVNFLKIRLFWTTIFNKWTRFAAAAAVIRRICAENRRFNPPTSPARVKSSIFSSLDLLPYRHFHLNLYKREISIKSFLFWSPERGLAKPYLEG